MEIGHFTHEGPRMGNLPGDFTLATALLLVAIVVLVLWSRHPERPGWAALSVVAALLVWVALLVL